LLIHTTVHSDIISVYFSVYTAVLQSRPMASAS